MGHGGASALGGSADLKHLASWGMERIVFIHPLAHHRTSLIPNSQFPMPNAQCPLTTNNQQADNYTFTLMLSSPASNLATVGCDRGTFPLVVES
jgi:hypothetical protein